MENNSFWSREFSIYLDLIRFSAALTVFLVHASFDRFHGAWLHIDLIGNHAYEAVMVFFVLSGLVISYVVDVKDRHWTDYTLNRMARLYSVAIPALILTALLDYIGSNFSPDQYSDYCCQNSYPLLRLMINALFVNELWFESVRPFSNAPYWSVGFEAWYYILFAFVMYTQGRLRVALVVVGTLIVGPRIVLLAPVWLMGVAVYYYTKRKRLSEQVGWFLFLAFFAAYGLSSYFDLNSFFREAGIELLGKDSINMLMWVRVPYAWMIGAIVAMNFIGFFAISHRFSILSARFGRLICYLAGITFSLYLFHYPILQFITALTESISLSFRGELIVLVTLCSVWLLGLVTEKKKHVVRSLIVRVIYFFPTGRKLFKRSMPSD
ncbi:acyltransferase family protein [Pseudomonadota bacterium]